MSDFALIIPSSEVLAFDATLGLVSFDAVLPSKEAALTSAAGVGRVASANDQEKAVAAQLELKRVLDVVCDAEEKFKAPLNKVRAEAISKSKTFRSEIEEELSRISRLIGDFQQMEIAKARAAEALRVKELQEADRKRQEELAKAQTLDERDEINSRHDEDAATVKPAVQPVRVAGQRVAEDWEIIVTDVWKLARSHPTCVDVKPRLSEIKAMLNSGLKVEGVTANKTIRATVRAKSQPLIDV